MPVISLNKGIENLQLSLTAAHMSQTAQGTTYYAETQGVSEYGSSEKKHSIASASVTNDNGKTFTCHAKFKITASGTLMDVSDLKAADGELKFHNDEKTKVEIKSGETFDILALKNASTSGVEMTADFHVSGSQTPELKADFSLVNTTDNQNTLAGKNVTINIKSTEFTCDTDVAE